MRNVFGTLGLACAVLALGGCARLGLHPLPKSVEETGGMQHGLDAFPEPLHPGEEQEVGLDPFPAALRPGESNDTGLDPFPPKSTKKVETAKLGLDPFPPAKDRKGFKGFGLNPFPARPKSAGPRAVTTASTKTVETDVATSEEYPDPPPVILPESPERNEAAAPVRKKKRQPWKDE